MSAGQAQTTSFGWRIGGWASVARDACLPNAPIHRAPPGEIAMAFQMFVFLFVVVDVCFLLVVVVVVVVLVVVCPASGESNEDQLQHVCLV